MRSPDRTKKLFSENLYYPFLEVVIFALAILAICWVLSLRESGKEFIYFVLYGFLVWHLGVLGEYSIP